MLWTRADGIGQAQPLTQSASQQIPWSFSMPGRRLTFVENSSPGKTAIWILPLEIDRSGLRAGNAELFLKKSFATRTPMVSPDGRWLAYMSDESGRYRVYVEAFPGGGRKRQISDDEGTYPGWSRNGHEIFFWQFDQHQPQGRLMVASWQTLGDSFFADKPRPWSGRRLLSFSTTRSYDPAPGGNRVVALMPAEDAQEKQDRLVFMLNFFDELRRRAPVSSK